MGGLGRWSAVRFLIGVLAVALAIGGFGAAGASANPTCTPEEVNIQGMGSSLQGVAQEAWTGRKVPFGLPLGSVPHVATSKTGYYKACETKLKPPTVSYTSTGAGSALAAFSFLGIGPINTTIDFIGTEDPPTAAEITNAEEVSAGARPIIVPVAQTAIAVVIHPPANCRFKAEKGITWKELNKVFGGNGITEWSQFANTEATVAGACSHPVKRVVRKEASGVTYQFKNYLSVLETEEGAEGLPCKTEGTLEWGKLKEISATGKPNPAWPQCAGGTEVQVARGDGALAERVAATEGTIGYAGLPAAKAKAATVALLQNGVEGVEPLYAEPGNSTTDTARCTKARYTVPVEGRRGVGTGEAVEWTTVFGAEPDVKGTEYPLCTLAFDIGWSNYEDPGYPEAVKVGEVVRDYIKNYVVPTGLGQAAIVGKWYSAMPNAGGTGSATDIQDAAEFAAEKLG